MTRLRPMEDEEYGPYLQVLRDAYIRDLLESGLMDRADAETKVEADIEAQLPEGPKTPDAYLYVIEDDAGGPVGYVWMARQQDQVGKPLAYVYDIWIHEGSRGRGLGRSAMVALEQEVRSLGLDRIHLNVFGYNTPARRLYESLGYIEYSVFMGKTLSD